MKKISWLNQYRIIRQHIQNNLINSKRYAHGRLLDVGCGTKPYQEIFADSVSEHIGVDLPANASANPEAKNVEAYSMLPHLPFKDESFDVVLATEVLEHVSEPSGALAEINRVLKPDGVLLLTTPQSWGIHEPPHDYYRYTRYGLQYLAEKNGFQVALINSFGGFFALIGQRLSSYIFNNLALNNGRKRNPLFQGTAHLLCACVQLCFSILDRMHYLPGDTLGHLMVAKKRERGF
jgi:ubiquinone/menaquinone biosynthesis C-methylase UbiE